MKKTDEKIEIEVKAKLLISNKNVTFSTVGNLWLSDEEAAMIGQILILAMTKEYDMTENTLKNLLKKLEKGSFDNSCFYKIKK